jgi:hypothetical protein
MLPSIIDLPFSFGKRFEQKILRKPSGNGAAPGVVSESRGIKANSDGVMIENTSASTHQKWAPGILDPFQTIHRKNIFFQGYPSSLPFLLP